jgi:hypothetical protein
VFPVWQSYGLSWDTKRGFYFALDSCLTVAQWATLNKGKPDPWEVNNNEGKKEYNYDEIH